jgi:2-oxoglutarate dehydrogenase E2 component (dihydrolipoamide succinyltransferase)
VSPFDPATPSRFEPEVHEGDTVERLSRSARFMAEHMAFTWWRAPHVSTLIEVDMTAISAARRSRTPKVSFTACIGWATARTLAEHRSFNSSLTSDHRRITHRDVNLGVAVARPGGGLVVPVIRGADRMTLDEFAAALADRIAAARAGRLDVADLRGGTFTLTNVGSNGNLASMPLINQPQVAIIAAGVIEKRVVVGRDEQARDTVVIRPMMYLTLTYDHRANDGAGSGRFLRRLRKRLERWDPDAGAPDA